VESYYTAHVWRGIFASFDVQHIVIPATTETVVPSSSSALGCTSIFSWWTL